MKETAKKLLVLVCVVAMVMAAFAGCATNSNTPAEPSDSAEPATDAQGSGEATDSDGKKLNIGLVYSNGGRGDRSINDLMYGAVERVCNQYGWEFSDLENEQASNVEPSNRQFCEQGKDVIINFGFGCIDVVNKLAVEYPEIKFITIDAVTAPQDNVLNFTFKEYEGSFLVGAIAGLMTENNKVGFVGGMENDMIKSFNAGYVQGVKAANPDAEVLSAYCGATVEAFGDPTKAKEIAISFYDTGADIIYHAAGGSGMGVFEAAIQKELWAIGVDANQQAEAPDNILTSMLKRADVAIENALTDIANDSFKSGHVSLGLAENGVGYVNDDTNEGKLPEDVVTAVEEFVAKIKAGEIEVSPTLE